MKQLYKWHTNNFKAHRGTVLKNKKSSHSILPKTNKRVVKIITLPLVNYDSISNARPKHLI